MKRIIAILVLIMLIFCGCSPAVDIENETLDFSTSGVFKETEGFLFDSLEHGEFRGAWLSYLEINPKKLSDKNEYRAYIGEILERLGSFGVGDLFLQVRPFADSIYKSELFETSSCVVKKRGDSLPFDFLKVIIYEAKKKDIRVHAWINPYRIMSETRNEDISVQSIIGKWLCDKKSDNIIRIDGGIYLNPASVEVQQLIINGVREILNNYDVAGIHIDNYFYPSDSRKIDEKQYENYIGNGGRLSLEEWRKENVSSLISGIYCAVKANSKSKIFSISPCADIAKNQQRLFADVEKWCSEDGWCDMIIPQIYFGFENETLPFESCANQWAKLCKSKKVLLCAGLAVYKAGKEDTFAGDSGKNEWKENSDILKRQVEYIRENGFDGFCLYSSQFVNFNEKLCSKELKNLNDVL